MFFDVRLDGPQLTPDQERQLDKTLEIGDFRKAPTSSKTVLRVNGIIPPSAPISSTAMTLQGFNI